MTRDQYNLINEVLSGRRRDAWREADRHREEVELKVSGYTALGDEMDRLSAAELKARLSGNKKLAFEYSEQLKDIIEKRRRLLEKYGYNENYLEANYTCPLCQDTGTVDGEKCGCFRKLESELIGRESGLPVMDITGDFASFDFGVYDDSVPLPELKRMRLTQKAYVKSKVIPEIKRYLDSFQEPGSHNLFLTGSVGTGKTFMCGCIARMLIDMQYTVTYMAAGRLYDLFRKDMFGRPGNDQLESALERIAETQLLVIDDLGTEETGEAQKSRLFDLINGRLNRGLSTVISSNLSLNDISIVYGERLASRIMGEYTIIPFYGNDIRVNKTGESRK